MKRINYTLMYGSINKDLRVEYVYRLDDDPESKYPTIRQLPESGTTIIKPSYGLSITEGYQRPRIFIPATHLHAFIDMISKTIMAVGKNFKALFPNAISIEFDIDQKALEEFTIKDAVSVNGYTALPCVYVTASNECKPAIRITSLNGDYVRITLTDAAILSRIFETFDPDTFGILLLNRISS